MDLSRLRQETAEDHRAVEGTVPLMDESLTRELYLKCLVRMHGVVSAWEDTAAAASPQWLHPLLSARRRTALLEKDLAWFGVNAPGSARPALPALNSDASLLGAMYVMEGSTLGGQLIARHVERVLNLTAGQGDAYFRGHSENTGAMWKEFCEVLRSHVPESQEDAVIHASKSMFQVFGSWMRSQPIAPES